PIVGGTATSPAAPRLPRSYSRRSSITRAGPLGSPNHSPEPHRVRPARPAGPATAGYLLRAAQAQIPVRQQPPPTEAAARERCRRPVRVLALPRLGRTAPS